MTMTGPIEFYQCSQKQPTKVVQDTVMRWQPRQVLWEL